MSGRVSPLDWCDAGLRLLRDEGMPALTVERLCGALKRTKGSFYHHFADLDAYLEQLLARWEATLTDLPIEVAAAELDPTRRAARLDSAVARLDHRLDVAVRAWALWDARARRAMERVDARRIAYLAELHRARGAAEAEQLAELEYAAFVGTQQVGAVTSPERAARLARDVRRGVALLVGGPRRG